MGHSGAAFTFAQRPRSGRRGKVVRPDRSLPRKRPHAKTARPRSPPFRVGHRLLRSDAGRGLDRVSRSGRAGFEHRRGTAVRVVGRAQYQLETTGTRRRLVFPRRESRASFSDDRHHGGGRAVRRAPRLLLRRRDWTHRVAHRGVRHGRLALATAASSQHPRVSDSPRGRRAALRLLRSPRGRLPRPHGQNYLAQPTTPLRPCPRQRRLADFGR